MTVSFGMMWQPAEGRKCFCDMCWMCDSGRKWHNERILRDRNVLHYMSLAGFVASCAMILPGVLFFAVETSNNEYSTVVRIPKATDLEWIFSLNEEENEIVRREFYYEQVRS